MWDRKLEVLMQFPFFGELDDRLQMDLESTTSLVHVPAGTTVFREGKPCDKVVFLGSGDARVFKRRSSGRQVTLYHVRPGDACYLNVACVAANSAYPAEAVTESPVEALVMTPGVFLNWFEKAAPVRAFVLLTMSQRFVEVLIRLEDTALAGLEHRLSQFLLDRLQSDGSVLPLTHEAVAAELGSVREVVSRLLKGLQERGAVRLQRGRIEILEEALLLQTNVETTNRRGGNGKTRNA